MDVAFSLPVGSKKDVNSLVHVVPAIMSILADICGFIISFKISIWFSNIYEVRAVFGGRASGEIKGSLAPVSVQTLTGELPFRRQLTTGSVPTTDSRRQLVFLMDVSFKLSHHSCNQRFFAARSVALVFRFVQSHDICPVSLQLKHHCRNGFLNAKHMAAPDILC